MRVTSKPANENEARDVDFDVRHVAFVGMSNVLSEAKKQQVIALGRLGWPLRRIEQETGVRRETAGSLSESGRDRSAAAGSVGTATAGKTGQRERVTTGSDAAKPTNTVNPNPNPNPKTFPLREKQKQRKTGQ